MYPSALTPWPDLTRQAGTQQKFEAEAAALLWAEVQGVYPPLGALSGAELAQRYQARGHGRLPTYCPTVLLSYCPTVLLSYCPTVLLSCCPTVLLSHCATVLLFYCPTVLLSYCPNHLTGDETTYMCVVYMRRT